MLLALAVLVGLLGLVGGSFLNVVAHRVPLGRSVVRPRSACPACGHEVRARDNVPVLSWLLLRGRCRDCQEPISPRYPLVELGTGVLFLLTFLVLEQRNLLGVLPAALYLAAISIALAAIDLDTRRLPNAIVLPSYPVLALLLVLASALEADWWALARAGMGGAARWLLYFLVMLAKPGGMGFGDVKLAGLLGAALGWFGWGSLVVGAFSAFLLGGLFSVGLLLAGRAGRKSAIPFGPWMLLGAWIGIFVGEPLWGAYLGILT
jgi:leader peptidase (prepilin peptidase)/N-methyltransferase